MTLQDLAARLRATYDIDDADDLDHVTTVIADEIQTLTGTIEDAVTALLASHASTGTDLTTWPGVIDLVIATHPRIVIEGTGPASPNTITSNGETGRYWIHGATEQPCNPDASVLHDSEFGRSQRARLGVASDGSIPG